MKILLSTSLFPAPDDPDVPSDADALGEFVAEWGKMGHEVTVLHAYLEERPGLAGKLMEAVPSIRYRDAEFAGATVHRAVIRCLKSHPGLRQAMMRRAAEHFNGQIGLYDLYLAHFPVITLGLPEAVRAGTEPIRVFHATDNQLVRDKKGRMPRRARALGFRSARIQADFHELCPWQGHEFLARSGGPDNAPHQSEYRRECLRILYAGKLIRRKQPDLLLRACAALPADVPWRLTIAGGGEMENELKDLTARLGVGDRVEMTGPLSHEDTLARMARADVFSLPSYRETFGLTYLEAMSRGAVAVGSRGEGIDGVIVDGENGFLLDAKDEAGLTALLARLWRMDGDTWQRLIQNGRATAQAMNGRAMALKYLDEAVKAAREMIK